MDRPKDKGKERAGKTSFTVLQTSECLKIDKTKINFCKYPIFASSFKQLSTVVELMDYFEEGQRRQFHLLRLRTRVSPFPNSEKFNLDKIFTIRAVEGGEEVSELELPIRDGEPTNIFVRASIPQLQVSTQINGFLELQVDQLIPLTVPIMSKGEVPQIVCLKQLEDRQSGARIIKIPSKGIMKIPFKNCSNINFSFEIKIIGRDPEKPDADGVRINVFPNQPLPQEKGKPRDLILRVDANSTFCVQLELENFRKDNPIRVARRILALQVQGTKLLFPFPLQIIISS